MLSLSGLFSYSKVVYLEIDWELLSPPPVMMDKAREKWTYLCWYARNSFCQTQC